MFSIIIPVGPGRTAEAALNSLEEAGLTAQDEVILVGDGHEVPIPETLRHLPVRSLQTKGKQGANAARNLGAEAANQDVLCFLDDDDAYLPGALTYIRKQVPDAKHTAAWSLAWDTVGPGKKGSHPWQYSILREKAIMRRNRAGGCSSLVIRKTTFNRVLGFDDKMASMQDWDFWLRLSRETRVRILRKKCILYDNRGKDRISLNREARIEGLSRLLRKHGGNWPRRVVAFHQARIDGERYKARQVGLFYIPKFWAPLASLCLLFKYAGGGRDRQLAAEGE